MKVKKIFFMIAVMMIAVVATLNVYLGSVSIPISRTMLSNMIALAQEPLDANYVRHEGTCTITGNGKVKLLSGTIIEVKGELVFDGKIVCSSGGNFTCTPIECAQLWQWIFT